MGIRRPGPDVRDYVIAVALGVDRRGPDRRRGRGPRLAGVHGPHADAEAVVLGILFGARLGLVAALAPLAGMGP